MAPQLTTYHAVRSVSFPTRSHHIIFQVEEELKNLKTWEQTSMSSTPDAKTFCIGLTNLERLFLCVNSLLNSQLTTQGLSHNQHDKLLDELLVRSMRLLDMCGSVKDVATQVKEHVRDIQSAQRRHKEEDICIDGSVLKKLKKNGEKAVMELKHINQIYCSKLSNVDNHIASVMTLVRDVSEVSVMVFGFLLMFMSVFISKLKSTSKWSLVSKLIHKGTSRNRYHHQICVEGFDIHVESIENGLASVFRRLISTRACLLNIKSN